MRQYRFTALVVLDPAADEDSRRCGRRLPSACCLVEPSSNRYFPAVISADEEQPARGNTARALVTIALHDGEAGAFFAPGQRFTIWADALVGQTIRADGLVGHGVICQCVSLPAPRPARDSAADRAASTTRTLLPGITRQAESA